MKLQDKLINSFEKFGQSLNGSETDSLRKMRTEGIEVFKNLGFPTTKDEECYGLELTTLCRMNKLMEIIRGGGDESCLEVRLGRSRSS